VHDQAFNVGATGQNFQVREIAETVTQAVPGSRVVYAEGGGPDIRNYRVDFSKLESAIPEAKPVLTLEEGVLELLREYQAHGLTKEAFQGSRYIRLAHIKHRLEEGSLDPSLRPIVGRDQPQMKHGSGAAS
jgi:hypothetical protein